MTRRRAILLWLGVPVLGFFAVMAGLDLWLNRAGEGVACAEATRDDLVGQGYDFSPRTTEEKKLQPAEVRTAAGQPYPDCFISQAAYRCDQQGPAVVFISHYGGSFRFFDIPAGETALLYGREGQATCLLQPKGRGG